MSAKILGIFALIDAISGDFVRLFDELGISFTRRTVVLVQYYTDCSRNTVSTHLLFHRGTLCQVRTTDNVTSIDALLEDVLVLSTLPI